MIKILYDVEEQEERANITTAIIDGSSFTRKVVNPGGVFNATIEDIRLTKKGLKRPLLLHFCRFVFSLFDQQENFQ